MEVAGIDAGFLQIFGGSSFRYGRRATPAGTGALGTLAALPVLWLMLLFQHLFQLFHILLVAVLVSQDMCSPYKKIHESV